MDKINTDWSKGDIYKGHLNTYFPSKEEVESAGRLVYAGNITTIKFMSLCNIDISDLSPEIISKLTSVVTGRINVRGDFN